ncbi:helix-turn-helix domain-containing protein [Novosphingobium bradum]|uniref:Helix-turn-helix domain-containing protein n=1 Tax=Novosphingobium bradum TaxID=1737444 RepID=A0ABV7IMP2_9SPHN
MLPKSDVLADPIPAACARLGVGRSTIYREIAEGRLAAVKARGRTLILRSSQEEWLGNLAPMRAKRAA